MTTPLGVRHVQTAIQRHFAGLIDLSDLPSDSKPDGERPEFLTRGLAALAVKHLSGCDLPEAAASIIDGTDDQGIDAVHVDAGRSRLWLVQSKWRKNGSATLDRPAALAMCDGIAQIMSTDVDNFNDRFAKLWPGALSAIENPDVMITVVIALLGNEPVHPDIETHLNRLVRLHGADMVEIHYLHLKDFQDIVRVGVENPKVDLKVLVNPCVEHPGKHKAFVGSVSAGQVKQWFDLHGDRLFGQNIRHSLGITRVNQTIAKSVENQPELFWYHNNGIRVVADSVRRNLKYSGEAGAPAELTVDGASIVNGAQTVAAVARGVSLNPQAGDLAQIPVTFISLEDAPPDLGKDITVATNTQNQVQQQDFVALDPVQEELRFEMEMSLNKRYIFKRGEQTVMSSPEESCTVVEVALALTCLQPRAGLVARIKENQDTLWETGSDGLYRRLFGDTPPAGRAWNGVLLLRGVRDRLNVIMKRREGRAEAIAEHADYLLVHILFQLIDTGEIDDLDADWGAELDNAVGMTEQVLDLIIHHLDNEYGATSFPLTSFKHAERCTMIARRVVQDMRDGHTVPILPVAYQPKRKKPRSVFTLIDANRIPEGTVLEFRPQTKSQKKVMATWLETNPDYRWATWVNDRARPLLCAADGIQYAVSDLTLRLLHKATDSNKPRSARGPDFWYLTNEGSLTELAEEIRRGNADGGP